MNVRIRRSSPPAWPRSRLGGVGLLLRHRAVVRGPALVVALLVLAVAALLAATPSVFATMTSRELAQTVAQAPTTSRYLISRPSGRLVTGPSHDPAGSGLPAADDEFLGAFQGQLHQLRDQLPLPLRELVGQARFSLSSDPFPAPEGALHTDPPTGSVALMFRMDPHLDRVAHLVAGSWAPPAYTRAGPVPVTISQRTAHALGLTVGSRVPMGVFGALDGTGKDRDVQVAGIFAPNDPQADYWALHPTVAQPALYDDGNTPARYTASAYVGGADITMFPSTALVWYPLELGRMAGTDAPTVLAQLRGAVATTFDVPTDLPTDVEAGTIQSLHVTADAIPALAGALGRVQAARGVLTVAAVGPLAAAIAVLVLAVRALVRRRRPLVGLLATRGAATSRLRLLLAADALVTGLPAAVTGCAAMWWLFRENASPAGLALGLAAGFLPAVMLAATPVEATMRPARADTGLRSRSRYRWVAEAAVLALAAVSGYLLFSAGLASGPGTGTDLLVASAPLLLAAAACVVTLRLYPLPLHLLSRVFRRRRAAVGYLGSVRALRDPVVGVAPVLAVLAGVSVAVFSAVTLSTVTHGTMQAALTQLGAPMRVTGVTVTDAQYRRIEQLPSVRAAARTMLVGTMSVQIDDEPTRRTADLYLADTAALAAVQRTVPGAVPHPGGMVGGPRPGVVISPDLAGPGATVRTGGGLSSGGLTGRVVATAPQLTGLGRSPDFVLADSSVTTFGPLRPDAVLIAPQPGADVAALRDSLTGILGPTVQIRVAADDVATLAASAIATGMRVALLGALAAAAIAAVAALLLTMVLTTSSRARLLAILRVLGLSVRQRRALVVWEQAPAAIMALLVGGGLGVGLAVLVRAAVDLTPFTGGRTQPDLHVGAGQLAALLGGFVVLVAAATWVGLLVTRRVTAATAIKLDEG